MQIQDHLRQGISYKKDDSEQEKKKERIEK